MADYFCTHCGCRHEPLEHIRHVSDREKLETLAAWLTEDDFTPAEIAAQELIAATKEMGASSLDCALSSETLTSLRGLLASGIETEGHDRAAWRGAEHESPTAESGDAQNIAQDIGGPSQ